MKPHEFLTSADDYNASIGDEMKARLEKDLRIFSSSSQEWVVLSYYLGDDGYMVLDICKKPKTKKGKA